jgi:hypothetical protein
MPTFDLTKDDAELILLGLRNDIPKHRVKAAHTLLERLKHQLMKPTAPPVYRIPSRWPSNDIKPERLSNSFWAPPPKPKVSLPKTTAPKITVDDVLKGLI